MKFVLDFDRVLFDTDAFIAKMEEEGLGDLPRDHELLDAVEAKGIDWQEFVNPGVLEFLQTYGQDCTIVSSYISRNRGDNVEDESILKNFQEEKIKRSGLYKLVSENVMTGRSKMADLESLYTKGAVLVDDEPEHIKAAKKLGFKTVWYMTPKKLFTNPERPSESIAELMEGDKVSEFNEFVDLVKDWENNN